MWNRVNLFLPVSEHGEGAEERAQQDRTCAIKPDSLSWDPRSHMMGDRTNERKLSSALHIHAKAQMLPPHK